MRSLAIHIRLGFSAVDFSFKGVPLLRVKGAKTTRCLSLIFPLAILMGWNSIDLLPVKLASPMAKSEEAALLLTGVVHENRFEL